jgi:hypothetical protein
LREVVRGENMNTRKWSTVVAEGNGEVTYRVGDSLFLFFVFAPLSFFVFLVITVTRMTILVYVYQWRTLSRGVVSRSLHHAAGHTQAKQAVPSDQ